VGERTIAAYVWKLSNRGRNAPNTTIHNASYGFASPALSGKGSVLGLKGSKKRVIRMEVSHKWSGLKLQGDLGIPIILVLL